MTRLLLVKHSLPKIVETVPAREWTLSSEGRERARELAEKLSLFQPDVIVSSLEPKARQTAEIIAEEWRLNVQALDGLHEHERSRVPFLPKGEFESLAKNFFENPNSLVFGDETAADALTRFQKAIDSSLRSTRANTPIVVSHGTVISLFVASVSGCDGYSLWQELELPSCVILDIETTSVVEKISLR